MIHDLNAAPPNADHPQPKPPAEPPRVDLLQLYKEFAAMHESFARGTQLVVPVALDLNEAKRQELATALQQASEDIKAGFEEVLDAILPVLVLAGQAKPREAPRSKIVVATEVPR